MNFSMSEMVVILLIALLVIKPEQLPDVAQTLGRFAKSVKSFIAKIRSEINSFMNAMEKPEKSTEQKREQQ